MPATKPMHCRAFAATGPATSDGKIVFGHITMFGLYPSLFYNVWLDVKPAKGHRVLMQTYPGGIQSGLDYYMNDAGLLVCETTIRQTKFDIQGMALASRIRQALQYADGIDAAADILGRSNNGLYTNEWLLGDIKTNEIAMLELGTAKTKLYRSSKNEWFGDAKGFYWGCNNTKDLDVRLETIPGVNAAPANMVWRPSDRDRTWLRLYQEHKGKIDVSFGKLAFTTPPVAAHPSLDAKFTTTDLARDLKTWAIFGPPLGKTWQPTEEEKKRYADIRPMVSNPWTVLHAGAPARTELAANSPVDLRDESNSEQRGFGRRRNRRARVQEAAWHGTILPRSDADIWLATAFADYERVVSMPPPNPETRDRTDGQSEASDEQTRTGLSLFAFRSEYSAGARPFGRGAELRSSRRQPRRLVPRGRRERRARLARAAPSARRRAFQGNDGQVRSRTCRQGGVVRRFHRRRIKGSRQATGRFLRLLAPSTRPADSPPRRRQSHCVGQRLHRVGQHHRRKPPALDARGRDRRSRQDREDKDSHPRLPSSPLWGE